MTVDREGSDGPSTEVETEVAPLCLAPTAVSAGASDPTAPINDVATLYASSTPGTDTVIRPTAVGVETFSQVRGALASKEISWHVALEDGQQLRNLSDGSVAVVEPAEPGATPPATDDTVAGPPSLAQRRQAVTDTELQVQHASDALERTQATTADGIVAVIPEPWAQDALDRPVATSLTAEGSKITMRLAPDLTAAYPIIAARQLFTADGVNTAEALRAAASTEPYSEAEMVAYEPPPESDEPPGAPLPPEDPPADDDLSDIAGSGSADDEDDIIIEDDDAGGDGSITPPDDDPSTPLAEAARNRILNIDLGLTDSDPGALDNPAYAGPDGLRSSPRWRFLRPFVTYKIGLIKKKQEEGKALTKTERERLGIWQDWYDKAKAAKYKADIAFTPFPHSKAPSVVGYQHALDVFLRKYGAVVDHVFAWNEPNYKESPLRRNPRRAAELWVAARRVCHRPKPERMRCTDVVAGDFAGKPGEGSAFKPRESGRRVGYTAAYHDWLERIAKNKDVRRPRIWSFHAYGDMKAWALKRSKARYSAPIIRRYARIFSRYKRSNGDPPKVWLSEIGAPYHYSCRSIPRKKAKRASQSLRQKYCDTNAEQTNKVVVLGQRLQRFAAAFLLKKVAQYPSINRIYYYNLMSRPPLRCNGSEDPAQPRALRCRRNEWGLLGADDDPAYLRQIASPQDGQEVIAKGNADYSNRGERRTAHPLLRSREPCRVSNPKRIKTCREGR